MSVKFLVSGITTLKTLIICDDFAGDCMYSYHAQVNSHVGALRRPSTQMDNRRNFMDGAVIKKRTEKVEQCETAETLVASRVNEDL